MRKAFRSLRRYTVKSVRSVVNTIGLFRSSASATSVASATSIGRSAYFARSARTRLSEAGVEGTDAVCRFRRAGFSDLKKRLQCQADDVRVLASKASRRPAQRLTQIGRQAHGHLVLHGFATLPCKSIVMHSHAISHRPP